MNVLMIFYLILSCMVFFEYISIPHVLKDNKCLDVYICRSNNYYETFADNISLDRLKTKIPLLLNTF